MVAYHRMIKPYRQVFQEYDNDLLVKTVELEAYPTWVSVFVSHYRDKMTTPTFLKFSCWPDDSIECHDMHWPLGIETPIDGYNTFRDSCFELYTDGDGPSSRNGPAVIYNKGQIHFQIGRTYLTKKEFEDQYLITHLKPFKRQHVSHWVAKYNSYLEVVHAHCRTELENISGEAKSFMKKAMQAIREEYPERYPPT